MVPKDLADKVIAENSYVNRSSLLSGIYRFAKDGKKFMVRSDSKIGLLEWREKKDDKTEIAQPIASNE
jgi:hypothetical protein